MVEIVTIENLLQVGGKEWQKNGMHRVYFNDLPELYGLMITRLLNKLCGSFWYDVSAGEFRSRGLSEDVAGVLKDAVLEKVAKLNAEVQ